jgi:hypothetical protein
MPARVLKLQRMPALRKFESGLFINRAMFIAPCIIPRSVYGNHEITLFDIPREWRAVLLTFLGMVRMCHIRLQRNKEIVQIRDSGVTSLVKDLVDATQAELDERRAAASDRRRQNACDGEGASAPAPTALVDSDDEEDDPELEGDEDDDDDGEPHQQQSRPGAAASRGAQDSDSDDSDSDSEENEAAFVQLFDENMTMDDVMNDARQHRQTSTDDDEEQQQDEDEDDDDNELDDIERDLKQLRMFAVLFDDQTGDDEDDEDDDDMSDGDDEDRQRAQPTHQQDQACSVFMQATDKYVGLWLVSFTPMITEQSVNHMFYKMYGDIVRDEKNFKRGKFNKRRGRDGEGGGDDGAAGESTDADNAGDDGEGDGSGNGDGLADEQRDELYDDQNPFVQYSSAARNKQIKKMMTSRKQIADMRDFVRNYYVDMFQRNMAMKKEYERRKKAAKDGKKQQQKDQKQQKNKGKNGGGGDSSSEVKSRTHGPEYDYPTSIFNLWNASLAFQACGVDTYELFNCPRTIAGRTKHSIITEKIDTMFANHKRFSDELMAMSNAQAVKYWQEYVSRVKQQQDQQREADGSSVAQYDEAIELDRLELRGVFYEVRLSELSAPLSRNAILPWVPEDVAEMLTFEQQREEELKIRDSLSSFAGGAESFLRNFKCFARLNMTTETKTYIDIASGDLDPDGAAAAAGGGDAIAMTMVTEAPKTPADLLQLYNDHLKKQRNGESMSEQERKEALRRAYYVLHNVRLREYLSESERAVLKWGDENKDPSDDSIMIRGKVAHEDGYGPFSCWLLQNVTYAEQYKNLNRNNMDTMAHLMAISLNKFDRVTPKKIHIVVLGQGEAGKSHTMTAVLGMSIPGTWTMYTAEGSRQQYSSGSELMNFKIMAYDEMPTFMVLSEKELKREQLEKLNEMKAITSMGKNVRVVMELIKNPQTGKSMRIPMTIVTNLRMQIIGNTNYLRNKKEAFGTRIFTRTVAKDRDMTTVFNCAASEEKKEFVEDAETEMIAMQRSLEYVGFMLHFCIGTGCLEEPTSRFTNLLLFDMLVRLYQRNITTAADARNFVRIQRQANEICVIRTIVKAYFMEGGTFRDDAHRCSENFRFFEHLSELNMMLYHTPEDVCMALAFMSEHYFDPLEYPFVRHLFFSYTKIDEQCVAEIRNEYLAQLTKINSEKRQQGNAGEIEEDEAMRDVSAAISGHDTGSEGSEERPSAGSSKSKHKDGNSNLITSLDEKHKNPLIRCMYTILDMILVQVLSKRGGGASTKAPSKSDDGDGGFADANNNGEIYIFSKSRKPKYGSKQQKEGGERQQGANDEYEQAAESNFASIPTRKSGANKHGGGGADGAARVNSSDLVDLWVDLNYLLIRTNAQSKVALLEGFKSGMDALPPDCAVTDTFQKMCTTHEMLDIVFEQMSLKNFNENILPLYDESADGADGTVDIDIDGTTYERRFDDLRGDAGVRIMYLMHRIHVKTNTSLRLCIPHRDFLTETWSVAISIHYLLRDDSTVLMSVMKEALEFAHLSDRKYLLPLLSNKRFVDQSIGDVSSASSGDIFTTLDLKTRPELGKLELKNPTYVSHKALERVEVSRREMKSEKRRKADMALLKLASKKQRDFLIKAHGHGFVNKNCLSEAEESKLIEEELAFMDDLPLYDSKDRRHETREIPLCQLRSYAEDADESKQSLIDAIDGEEDNGCAVPMLRYMSRRDLMFQLVQSKTYSFEKDPELQIFEERCIMMRTKPTIAMFQRYRDRFYRADGDAIHLGGKDGLYRPNEGTANQ